MKLGFILECGPQGADLKVCKNFVSRIRPNDEFFPITLDNKPKLISGCGKAALQLLNSGCDKIFIIWDLFPDWRDDRTRPCRNEDVTSIINSLNSAQVPLSKVSLVCIEQELEAWLIADGRAISDFLSTPTKAVLIKHETRPDRVQNPKKKLNQYFTQNRGNGYNYIDYLHAEKLVALIPDFKKIKKSESFKRFYFKLSGNQLL